VLAAADPFGNQSLVRQAAGRLGIPLEAAEPVQAAGLVDFGMRVRFRHPLARSAAYLGVGRGPAGDARRAGGGG
jgi:hypothetical protein